jgi:hypothetical protein
MQLAKIACRAITSVLRRGPINANGGICINIWMVLIASARNIGCHYADTLTVDITALCFIAVRLKFAQFQY